MRFRHAPFVLSAAVTFALVSDAGACACIPGPHEDLFRVLGFLMVAGLLGGLIWMILGLGKLWKSVSARDAACKKSMADEGRRTAWRGLSLMLGVSPVIHLLETFAILGEDSLIVKRGVEIFTWSRFGGMFSAIVTVVIFATIFRSTFGDQGKGRKLRRIMLYALLAIILLLVAVQFGPAAVRWFQGESPYFGY